MVKNGIKERLKVFASGIRIKRCSAFASGAEKHRAFKLFFGSIEIKEKFKNFVSDIIKSCIGFVNFVDNNNYGVIHLKSSLENESGLGHRAFCCVNKKDNAVYHFENTFNFTAEVCVSGSIDDIDFYSVIMNRSVFCKDGNASFTFKVAGVHNTVLYNLVITESAALFEHFVNNGGFTVVNVCDNCNVS